MREILIAAFVALFSISATALAQETTQPVPPVPSMPAMSGGATQWQTIAVAAGAVAGIWAVNVATGGLTVAPVAAAVVSLDLAALNTPVVAARIVLVAAGAITGGYFAAWLSDI